ncbi:unnamed protein product [Tetraodon nigroviridis]|uniref:Chromosome undetermined SCAF23534, whole genome shotgun sequence n=1 Tax=Tetraodon nigroviridis TaxID=99883 RepID=Q4RAK0_TETNG|nr:unnamed protein product [Tetraodon nigroviridis]
MPGSAAPWAALAAVALLLVGSVGAAQPRSTLPPPEATSAAAPEEPSGERGGCPGRCRCEAPGRVDCSDLGLREVPTQLGPLTSYL